jgi:colanic acid/amylovoran biosynthesis glycosyltransferase
LLARSETFIRSEALALRRYSALFVGGVRQPGLELPEDRVLVGVRSGRVARVMQRRVPGYDPIARLGRLCRAREVRLVHAHFGTDAPGALRLARVLNVPLIVTFWGFDATMYDDALVAAGGSFAAFVRHRPEVFEEACLLIGVSRFIADELHLRGAPESKLRVHHVGVPLTGHAEATNRPPIVLFVGRHVEKKGLGTLIEAMAQVRDAVPDAQLRVVGDGPLRAEYETRCRSVGIDVEFAGWLGPEQVGQEMTRARVLCVPSQRADDGDAEGLPTVIPEAGARGLPVVATRHSGIPEATGEDRGGLLADERDAKGIAGHLIAVLTDNALWRRLSETGRDNVRRNFDPQRQVAELESLYDEALNHRA